MPKDPMRHSVDESSPMLPSSRDPLITSCIFADSGDSTATAVYVDSEAEDFPDWLQVDFTALPDVSQDIQPQTPDSERAMPWFAT